jgi:hypothetical protein
MNIGHLKGPFFSAGHRRQKRPEISEVRHKNGE